MSQNKLSKLIPRSPRYIIEIGDEQFIRLIQADETEKKEIESLYPSKLLDISSTGLAFLTHKNSIFKLGEKIKIEFPVPGFRKVAWWATVVRVQIQNPPQWEKSSTSHSPEELIVGIQFYDLPPQHREVLFNEIRKKIKEVKKRKRKALLKKIIKTLGRKGLKIFLIGAFILCILYFLLKFLRNY